MIKLVPASTIKEDDSFRYDFKEWNYPLSLLRSCLYSPDDPNLCDDDHALVMDYDGFIEWFPEWNHMYEEENDEDWYKDDEGAKYLPYHLGRTVSVVKEAIQ